MDLKIKVCGMKNPQNIEEVVRLKPDFMGFIFYSKSKRFIGDFLDPKIIHLISPDIQKVGVFVNESFENLVDIQKKYSLDYLQLHGEESVELCERLKKSGCKIIKVFSVGNDFDFSQTKEYEEYCSYFLFDTKGDNYGGNGIAFNWQLLNNYPSEVPYFLSGGIGLENLEMIKEINSSFLYAVDVNSRFETEPGLKDISKLKELFNTLKG